MRDRGKRIILCLDGTWDNSDKAYQRPTHDDPNATLQVPSNVTRIYRTLSTEGLDGKRQIMYYHPGVGSTGGFTDTIEGGVFGAGISENIREAYSFLVTNYDFGDEIIIIGFSRGAFTARSVAGLVAEIGLLTRKGMEDFYPIFKDAENSNDPNYEDQYPTRPFPNKPRPPHHEREYRRRLAEGGFTRVVDPDGHAIKIRCVAVWETVGSLGIPNTNFASRHGLPRSTKQFRFYDTSLSDKIEYAFQALALDENRTPFAPAVWERPSHVRTELRQVWFPGSHANVGGGWPDQEIANVSMAWMMDQLATIGVAIEEDTIDRIFNDSVCFYFDQHLNKSKHHRSSSHDKAWRQWAVSYIYDENKPVRPYGLGRVYNPETAVYRLAGETTRTPGMYHRINPRTGVPTHEFLHGTNERIHRSVRLRLGLEGLGYDDVGLYKCPALLERGPWRLQQLRLKSRDVDSRHSTWIPSHNSDDILEEGREIRWVWVYDGPSRDAPPEKMMLEEPLGPNERRLLKLNKGRAHYKTIYSEKMDRR